MAVTTAAIAGCWLVIFPRLAARDPLQSRLQWLETRGIDPAAMYYTELEAMEPILERLEKRRRDQQ